MLITKTLSEFQSYNDHMTPAVAGPAAKSNPQATMYACNNTCK